MNEEGWYIDPFGRHEARWISDGTPTALVRDGEAESQDPPPDEPITVEMELSGFMSGRCGDLGHVRRSLPTRRSRSTTGCFHQGP
jgi:hypothetical protein